MALQIGHAAPIPDDAKGERQCTGYATTTGLACCALRLQRISIN